MSHHTKQMLQGVPGFHPLLAPPASFEGPRMCSTWPATKHHVVKLVLLPDLKEGTGQPSLVLQCFIHPQVTPPTTAATTHAATTHAAINLLLPIQPNHEHPCAAHSTTAKSQHTMTPCAHVLCIRCGAIIEAQIHCV